MVPGFGRVETPRPKRWGLCKAGMLLQAGWAAILIFFQRCWERDCTETYFLNADAGSLLLLFLAAHVSLWRLLESQAAARCPLQQEAAGGDGWSSAGSRECSL